MNVRSKLIWINVFVVTSVVVFFTFLWGPSEYQEGGTVGLVLFVVTFIAVAAVSTIIRTVLSELLIVKRVDVINSEHGHLKASMGSLSLGFITTDSGNNIVLMNARARQILADDDRIDQKRKWTVGEIAEHLGKDFDLAEQLSKSLKRHKTAEFADVAYHDSILRILVSPILPHTAASGCVIILEDITEQKLLERSKDEFLSIASHELRTPLTAIRGNTALIEQYYAEKINDKALNEMLFDIHDSSVRLIGIVNDFLDASRLEQGKIKFNIEPFDISEVLENVTYETVGIAKEKGDQIVIDKTLKEAPQVYADKDRVKQVIYNLIGNAMKFTDDGKITIDAQRAGEQLKVSVTDNGPGIPAEKQKLLFRKFQQVGPNLYTRETTRGTGMGLYISKLLVESMGGSIGLERSEPGVGTTFSFTLPLYKA